MTTPSSGGFEYTDDSVVARLSFDIPGQALSEISQLTQAMDAMRTQLEAISRAQADWLGYLNQVPQITERANQVLRDQITLMERLSYVQNEIGGGAINPVLGAERAQEPPVERVAGGAGVGSYSTAAAPGFSDYFRGMMEGTGQGPNLNAAAQRMAEIGQDPRVANEMLAARGVALNPAVVGTITGAVAGTLGTGQTTQGSTSNQATQQGRTSANPPDANAGGAPSATGPKGAQQGGAWTNIFADSVMQEITRGARGGMVGQILSKAGGLFGGGGDDGSGGQGGGPGGPGGPGGNIPGAGGFPGASSGGGRGKGFSAAQKAGLGAAVGVAGLSASQRIGERLVEYQQLGVQEGGNFGTGMLREAEARLTAIDPFLSTEQARMAMQMPINAGFRGDQANELQQLMGDNFKKLGISFADTMKTEMINLRGVELTDENVRKDKDRTEDFNQLLKNLSKEPGLSLKERQEQAVQMKENLKVLGLSAETIEQATVGMQEGYSDSVALRGDIPRIMDKTMKSGTMLSVVAARNGVTGYLPSALPRALEEAGINPEEVQEKAAIEVAQQVSGLEPYLNRVAAFMDLMGQYGVPLDFDQAEDMYNKVTKGKKPTERAKERLEKNKSGFLGKIGKMFKPTGAMGTGISAAGDLLRGDVFGAAKEIWQGGQDIGENLFGQRGADGAIDRMSKDDGFFSRNGKKAPDLPKSAQQVQQTVTTQGQVTGNVTITIDSSGRVTAPPSIQLTGQQKAALAGAGSAQMNNAPPGDPNYNHSYNPFPGAR